jgi:hypothetical protein
MGGREKAALVAAPPLTLRPAARTHLSLSPQHDRENSMRFSDLAPTHIAAVAMPRQIETLTALPFQDKPLFFNKTKSWQHSCE